MANVDRVTVELVAQTENARRNVERYATAFVSADQSITRSATSIEGSTARAANASRNLGRQVADIGTGLAGGQSPFLIIAQQAPQVADALADTAGRAAKVATFFAGPWGAAILAAASVLGVLIGKSGEASDSLESMVKKLEDNERKARLADAAQLAFSNTVLGAAKASRELNKELKEQNRSQEENARVTLASAEAQRQKNIQIRQGIADQLKSEISLAQQRLQNSRLDPNASVGNAVLNIGSARQIAKLTADLAIAQQAVADATNATIEARIPLMKMNADANSTREAQLTRDRDNAVQRLEQTYRRAAAAANQLGAAERQTALRVARDAYESGVVKANQGLEASLQAIKDAETASNRAQRAAETAAKRAARERQKDLENFLKFVRNIPSEIDKAAAGLKVDRHRLSDIEDNDPNGDQKAVEDQLKERNAGYQADADERFRADRDTENKLQEIRKQNVRTLASLYVDLFENGTKGFVKSFERLMLQALAKIAAEKTIAALGGGGSSFLSSLGSLFGGKPAGRASGGYVAPHSLYRVNEARGGAEFLRMGSQGGTVIPLGQAGAATGGGTTVLQTLQFDLNGAVLTSDLLAQMNQMAQAAAVRGAAGGSALAQGAIARRQRYRLG